MRRRVIQVGAGNVGLLSLRQVIAHPELELVGLQVHTPAKVGRDAGELTGGPPIGILASDDIDALLALDADCIVHMGFNPDIRWPAAGTHSERALEEVCRYLASGNNVVATSLTPLVWPTAWGTEPLDRLNAACAAGRSSFRDTGIHPGFVGSDLAAVLTGACEEITSVRIRQIGNKGQYNEPNRLRLYGFGLRPDEVVSTDAIASAMEATYATCLYQLADVLGLTLESVKSSVTFSLTATGFDIPAFHVEAGTIAATRIKIAGIVAGREVLVVDQVTRAADDVAAEWPVLPHEYGFSILVEGRPALQLDLQYTEPGAVKTVESCRATAALAVNAIGPVCAARPGVLSFLDLPPVTGRGLVRI